MHQLTQAARRSPHGARLALCTILVVLAGSALVAIGRASAERGGVNAPAKVISTQIPKADGTDAVDFVCTTSVDWTGMPDMGINFKLGGNAPRAVLVLFQAEWALEEEGAIALTRLLIDGVIQPGPADVEADTRGVGAPREIETHGFNFLSDPLQPGTHFARIQWKSIFGELICTSDRSLIVLHK